MSTLYLNVSTRLHRDLKKFAEIMKCRMCDVVDLALMGFLAPRLLYYESCYGEGYKQRKRSVVNPKKNLIKYHFHEHSEKIIKRYFPEETKPRIEEVA